IAPRFRGCRHPARRARHRAGIRDPARRSAHESSRRAPLHRAQGPGRGRRGRKRAYHHPSRRQGRRGCPLENRHDLARRRSRHLRDRWRRRLRRSPPARPTKAPRRSRRRKGQRGRREALRSMSRLALSVLVLLAGFAPVPAHAATEITFGITSATAFSLPHYIATEKKLYEAEALAVDTIVAGAAAGVLKQ